MSILRQTFPGILTIGIVFLAAAVVFGSWYTVPEGYRGVVTRNGAVVDVAQPGLGFKVPFIDQVTDVNIQTQKEVFEQLAAYSRDIQQSESRVTVNYHLSPDSVDFVYAQIGLNYADKILRPAVYKRIKEIFGQYTAADIVARRGELGLAITTALHEELAEESWLIVESVQIENIDFSDAYEAAVEAAAQAEAGVKRAKQELEKIKIDAQQKVAQAQAEAEARRLAADAEAYQIKAKGDAEAQAIRARADALRTNPNLIDLMAVEKWSGSLPTTMVPNSTLPFLNMQAGAR